MRKRRGSRIKVSYSEEYTEHIGYTFNAFCKPVLARLSLYPVRQLP